MTRITPRLLISLHFLQIRFTEALTFMFSPSPKNRDKPNSVDSTHALRDQKGPVSNTGALFSTTTNHAPLETISRT